jgi:hypothetical protein
MVARRERLHLKVQLIVLHRVVHISVGPLLVVEFVDDSGVCTSGKHGLLVQQGKKPRRLTQQQCDLGTVVHKFAPIGCDTFLLHVFQFPPENVLVEEKPATRATM